MVAGIGAAHAAAITTLVSFNGTNGSDPQSGLVMDSSGNLFGTTFTGGTGSRGTVFKLSPNGSAYTFSSVFSFNGTNGQNPAGNLLLDSSGAIYGTTQNGGAAFEGNAFKLTKSGSSYAASTPATFTGTGSGKNGSGPRAGLIADSSGNLFGTTNAGGANGYGTVYELVKSGSTYTLKTLLTFDGTNGGNPFTGLVADSSGNLFGTTETGGAGGRGIVYELVKSGTSYTFTTIASFNGTNGADPDGDLTIDANGNLFGATYEGGAHNAGAVFELTKTASAYALSTLASFDTSNGYALGGLVEDAAGNLFGTTFGNLYLGDGSNKGMVFEVANGGSGYSLTPLVTFNGTNGSAPEADLFVDAKGNLYGTTSGGGASGKGTVFEVTNSGYVQAVPTAVPEPGSLVVAAGIVLALATRWRDRRPGSV